MPGMGNRELCFVLNVKLRVDSVVVQKEGWADAADQTY